MLDTIASLLDWFGISIFALSGALVASRKQMDIVGFVLLGCVTGIGGGTIRDVLLGALPVFWVKQPSYLMACVLVSCAAFFVVHLVHSRMKYLLWSDAVGLALFSVTGAEVALSLNNSPAIAVAMGVTTATMGGVVRDVLGGEVPVILRREIYVTAALLGAAALVAGRQLGFSGDVSLVVGFVAAFLLRAAAIRFDLSLPVFKHGDSTVE